MNPPNIRIRDLGSLNGTYVNGQKIGQRQRDQTPEEAAKLNFPEYDLENHHQVQAG
ncbi:FHA domain-containing protein, partial [Cronbergia sp. UHCC 0137]|uniref:FHA domain-containing protein n=1 Tax=Cronbergia sp. UHCC 0137 TaxID=3110239 RepID=UPI002B1EA374